MPKASQLKKNNVVKINNSIYKVRKIMSRTTSARGASTLYQITFEEIQTRQRLEKTVREDEQFNEVDLSRKAVQYLYQDGDSYVFMNTEDYTQYTLTAEKLESQTQWLTDGLDEISALFLDSNCIGIILPHTVDLEIVDTTPPLKGATATSQSKPATLTTSAEVQVPEYLTTGDTIRINTETGEFVTRV